MVSFNKLLARINAGTFMCTHHLAITRLEKDCAEGELEVWPDTLNPHGFVHGGALTALADTVAGVAASTRGGRCVTLNQFMSYLRPATGRKILCRASPQRVGRTVSVFNVTLTDSEGRMVATGTFTFHVDRTADAVGLIRGDKAAEESGSPVE